ncbi:MAG: winged helix-turn-helix domain-containing protein [Candidatus Dormibacteria bacterium]
MGPGAKRTTSQLADDAFAGGSGLLPNEDPSSQHAVDARRWIVIYTELVEFKNELLERLEAREDISPEARTEMETTDLRALTEQRARYQARLDYWYTRHSEIQGLDIDPATRVMRHRDKSVGLTGREMMLLSYLLSQPGKRFTPRQLAEKAWHKSALPPEEVRTYVGRLRHKMASVEARCRIDTQPRLGYSLVFDE